MNLKKTLAILIGASMLCSTSVSAQPFDNSELEYEMVQTEKVSASSGTCGENLTWTLDDAGTLTICGTGDMMDYYSSNVPWYSNRSSIKTVIIGDGVTSIGMYAFLYCSSLTSITIPDSVTSIGGSAFGYCSSLTSITIPDSVTSIGGGAFTNCSSLTSITIPDSVTSIGYRAFEKCSSLTSITIPDSVTSIGYYAFGNCSSLVSITVDENNEYYSSDEYGVLFNKDKTTLIQYPKGNGRTSYTISDGVTSIGEGAFSYCSSLTSVTIPDSVTKIDYSVFFGCSSLTSVTIGNSVTSIGDYAFENCSSLTSITIPDSVTSIGEYTSNAFNGCSKLETINVQEGNGAYVSVDGVLFNKDKTAIIRYPEGKSGTSYTIPDSVTSIGNYAFWFCSSLTSITIPDSVTIIGISAFSGCSSLTSITIPDSVTSIGEGAFDSCSSLTSVTIGNSVTNIFDSAFEDCSSLTTVVIPDSVTNIGGWAFLGCSSLTDVYYTGSEEQWNEISIGYGNEDLLNANITFNYRNVICEGTRETAAKDGTFELMIGGTSFGKFTFTSVDGGFTVMNEDGEYLSLSNRKLVFGDDAGIWTYNNGRLSISTGSRFFARNYYLTASRNALTVSTSTRNTDITLLEEFSLNTHTFGDYIDNGDGTHSLICEYCGLEESESCVYGDDHKCICGAVDKAYVSLEISVEVNKTTTGSFFKRTNYVATITVDALGIDVAKVQYSTNNRRWYTGTSYSSRSNITTLYVRVTDTDGNVYDYTYKA